MSDGTQTYLVASQPQGMFASTPPTSIPQGGMRWIENYTMWEGGHKSRRGFSKHNKYAIPEAGLRLNGVDQYVQIEGGDDDKFKNESTHVFGAEIAFIMETVPENDGDRATLIWRGTGTVGEDSYHLFVERVSGVLQVGLEVEGFVKRTAFTASDQMRAGVGYRVSFYRAQGNTFHIIIYSEDVGRVTSTSLAMAINDRTGDLTIGRTLINGAESYLHGTVQDFRYWRIAISGNSGINEDTFDLNYDTILNSSLPSELLCWIVMNESDGERMRDETGNGFDGYRRPGIPQWVSPGLVDNSPSSFCLRLDPRQSHRLAAYDYPSGLGSGSLFKRMLKNSAYEFTVSMAFQIDKTYIDTLSSSDLAPSYLPLCYVGDEGASGLGVDVGAAGEWAIYVALENTGTTSAPEYKPRLFVNGDTAGRKQILLGSAFTRDIDLDVTYRIDVIRSRGQYFVARLYKSGERGVQQSAGGENQYATEATLATDDLYNSTFTNGLVALFGVGVDSGNHFFPGKIDDIRLFASDAETLPPESNVTMHTFSRISSPHDSMLFYGLLNEGQGEWVTDSGPYDNNRASLFGEKGQLHRLQPASNLLPSHGAGWVKPSRYIDVQGLHAYKDIETSSEILFVAAASALWASAASFDGVERRYNPIYHGLTGETPMRFAHVNNQLIMGNGVDPNLRWDGKALSRLGIDAPTTAPGVNVVTSGTVLAGTYTHVYCWKNSKTGGRSNPSAPTTTTTTATGSFTITVSTPDAGNDPLGFTGVDTVEIWRTLAGGGTYYYVGEQKLPIRDGSQSSPVAGAVMPPFSDNVSDAILPSKAVTGTLPFVSLTQFSPLPKCKILVSAKGRLVGLGTERYPNRILLTEIHYPDHHDPSTQFIDDIDAGDGDEITGAVYTNDLLYVFLRRSIWAASGIESDQTVQVYQLYDGVGCVEHRTIQVLGGTIVWRGEENFYRMDPGGASPVPIGQPVKSLLDEIDVAKIKYETSGVLVRDGVYLCSATSQIGSGIFPSTRNDYIFALNVHTGMWGMWSFQGLGAFANLDLSEYSELFALNRNGFVYRYTGIGGVDALATTRKASYADGLDREHRTRFTLAADLFNTATFADVNESLSVDTVGDGMKGCTFQYRLADGSLSRFYVIRKVEAEGTGHRIHLVEPVSETLDATIGLECYVGGYKRRLLSPEITFGQPFQDAVATQIAMIGEAESLLSSPNGPPDVTALDGSSTLVYAYSYAIDGVEGPISPPTTVVGAIRVGTRIVMEAPDVDLGTVCLANLYLLEPFTHGYRLIYQHDASTMKPGESIIHTDAGGFINPPNYVLYDPWKRSGLLEVTQRHRIRGQAKRTSDSVSRRVVNLSGESEWRGPGTARGSAIEIEVECTLPDAKHEIHHLGLMLMAGAS